MNRMRTTVPRTGVEYH